MIKRHTKKQLHALYHEERKITMKRYTVTGVALVKYSVSLDAENMDDLERQLEQFEDNPEAYGVELDYSTVDIKRTDDVYTT